MPPDTHIEMLSAEAERQPEPPKEAGPNLEALGAAAADLGRRLVWLPGTHSSRFFSERYRALAPRDPTRAGDISRAAAEERRWATTFAG